MRIRSVKPEFWRDRPLATLSADARLFYIGLWQEADDAGWLRWDLVEIAADLYPYRPAHSRERQIVGYSEALMALAGPARLVVLECGHAQLTRLTGHQRLSGKPVTNIYREHQRDCAGQSVVGPGSHARSAAAEHETSSSPHTTSTRPAADRGRPAAARHGRGGEGREGGATHREGRGGVEGKPTNGAQPTLTAIDELVVMAGDPSSPGHGAARKALAKRAPDRLAELDADTVAAVEPSEAVARPRRAAGA